LYGFWVASYVAFNGDAVLTNAGQFLALAKKQTAIAPIMVGHRISVTSQLLTGDSVQARTHFDQALALYDPATHRTLATRFGQDIRVSVLCYRAIACSILGYHDAALSDAKSGLDDAREIGQAAELMHALFLTSIVHFLCGDFLATIAHSNELY